MLSIIEHTLLLKGHHTGFSRVTILSPTIHWLHWKQHGPVEEHLCKFRMFIESPRGEDVEPNLHVPEDAARNPLLLDQTTFFLWRHNNAWLYYKALPHDNLIFTTIPCKTAVTFPDLHIIK